MRWVDAFAPKFGWDRLVFKHEPCGNPAPVDPTQEEPGPEFCRMTRTRIMVERLGRDEDGDIEFGEDAIDTAEIGDVMSCHLLGGYALDAGADIVEEAEATCPDAHDAATMLYGEDGRSGLIWSMENTGYRHNALYVHEIFVKPAFRGHGLGAMALRRVIEYHDPAGLAYVVLFPNAKHLVGPRDPLDTVGEKEAHKKLVSYYKRLGFRPYKRTGFVYAEMEYYDHGWRNKPESAVIVGRPPSVRRVA